MSIKTRVDRAEAEAGVGPFDPSVLSDEELLRLHDLLSRPGRSAEVTAEAERVALHLKPLFSGNMPGRR